MEAAQLRSGLLNRPLLFQKLLTGVGKRCLFFWHERLACAVLWLWVWGLCLFWLQWWKCHGGDLPAAPCPCRRSAAPWSHPSDWVWVGPGMDTKMYYMGLMDNAHCSWNGWGIGWAVKARVLEMVFSWCQAVMSSHIAAICIWVSGKVMWLA